jgi:hypothetical protein
MPPAARSWRQAHALRGRLAHPELVDEDADPRVVLVVAGAAGDEVGGAGVYEVDISRLVGKFVIGVWPQLGVG